MKNYINIHPGEILEKEFLEPMSVTAYKLSKAIGVQQTRISQIIKEQRGITADTAIRFAKYFGTSAEFWMNLQREHDLRKTMFEKKIFFENIVPLSA